jgi:ketol-acid reductoisomerase
MSTKMCVYHIPFATSRLKFSTLRYYDSDADLNILKDKTIVFLGWVLLTTRVHDSRRSNEIRFGNQGSAQAQNLRDSGIPNEKIVVANREDSYVASAKDKGFNVEHDFGKAAEVADGNDFMPKSCHAFYLLSCSVIFLLVPDQVQPRVFNEQVAPKLKDTACIVIASGYNVFYKLLNFTPMQDVVMVAPRYHKFCFEMSLKFSRTTTTE